MKSPNLSKVLLLICLQCALPLGAAPTEEPIGQAISPKIYPSGLYPNLPPREPTQNLALATGGYDVLTNLTGVTGLQTDAVVGSASGSNYVFDNLRIRSAQTTFDDYLIGYYTFDLATQRLSPTKFEKAPTVGVYEPKEKFFIKDNTASVNFFTNPATPTQFGQGILHTFQSGVDYFSNLSVAQRLTLRFSGMPANQLLRLILTKEDGTAYYDERVNTSTAAFIVISGAPVLLTGKYRMRIEAITPTAAFNFGIMFYNENGAVTTTAVTGNTLSASLGGSASGNGLPYKKFKIPLTNGQTVSIPGDSDTNAFLIDSRGATVLSGGNAGINKTVIETGDYYIIITPRDSVSSSSESYSGVLTIANSLSFLDWGASHGLPYGRDGASQDADGDGMKNLLEYSLGLNPSKADSTSAVAASVTASQFSISYNRPNYLTGVSVQPQVSSNLIDWVNATGTATGTTPGNSVMTVSTPKAGNTRKAARIKVTQTP
jgi:hypothetical protein